jgi:hypothetical protein
LGRKPNRRGCSSLSGLFVSPHTSRWQGGNPKYFFPGRREEEGSTIRRAGPANEQDFDVAEHGGASSSKSDAERVEYPFCGGLGTGFAYPIISTTRVADFFVRTAP